MKTRLILSIILTLSPALCALSQIPQGFNYQAIARDASGNPIVNTAMPVRITIQSEQTGGTIFWQELHSSVTTNDFGMLTLVVGQGTRQAGTAATFADIDWSVTPKYIKTEIDYNGWKEMGVSQLWAVPYSMAAEELAGSVKKLTVAGETTSMEEPLFEVKNKNGRTVFAVYNEGVRAYVSDGDAKGVKGGFAIGSFDSSKGERDLFIVTTDSIRAYIYDDPLNKGVKGGFAIGGFDDSKRITNDYLLVSPDSVRIYLDHNTGKGVKGGFAIGSFDDSKNPGGQKYLVVSRDSVRVYIDEEVTKGVKGGFAIGSFDDSKAGKSTFFDVSPNTSDIILSENRILWYPVKNAFLTGRVNIEHPDSVGTNSFASGYESKAKGQYSQALGYQAIARGDYSTAIGKNALANMVNSFAFGDSSFAINQNSYAFGKGAVALGKNSFSLGEKSQASGIDSYAIGHNAKASGRGSYAFGSEGYDQFGMYTGRITEASGDYSIAMGLGSVSNSFGAVAIGLNVESSAYAATALGSGSKAKAAFSIAAGLACQTEGTASMAFGMNNSAIGAGSFVGGSGSTAYGESSFAFGSGAHTISGADYSVAFGENTKSYGKYSFSGGYRSEAKSKGCFAYGDSSIASGSYSIALGYKTQAITSYSIALGYKSSATGINSIAIGSEASASYSTGNCFSLGSKTNSTGGNGSLAMGIGTTASGSASFAVGPYSTASGSYSTSLGYGITVSGEFSCGIALSNQTGTNISQSNTLAIMGGSVGIGTTTPAYKLDVTGDARITGVIRPNWIEVSADATGNRYSGIDFHGDDTYSDYSLRIYRYNTGPDAYSRIWHRGLGPLQLYTNEAAPIDFYTSGSHRLRIADNGNIGIGISTPGYKLDVNGEIVSRNKTAYRLRQETYSTLLRNDDNDFWILLTNSGDPGGTWNSLRPFRIELSTGNVFFGDGALTVFHGGNTGIGANPSSSYKLYVNGSAYATGSWTSSDIKWKKNIQPLTGVLNDVSRLQLVSYDWRTEEFPDLGFDNDRHIGLIAQDVEKVFPLLVRTNEDGSKAIAYDKLSAVLVEAIKEQQQQIESEKAKNKELENELVTLKERLSALEAMMGKK